MEVIMGFLASNWVSVVLVAVVLVWCGVAYKQGYKRNVYILLLQIVNEVEEKYGNEKEDIKYDIVLGKIYNKLPKALTWLYSKKELDTLIKDTIDEVQLWLEEEIEESK